MTSPEVGEVTTCYRHPGRETGVRCQRCERPICPECMVPAPVGVQCVECVRRLRPRAAMRPRLRNRWWASVTNLLIVVNVLVYLVGVLLGGGAGLISGSPLAVFGGLAAQPVAVGQWYRIFTAAFLHSGMLHVGFNMAVLYLLGPPLEQALGRLRYCSLYLVGIVAGSLGALVASPGALTVGASGAIFGLMTASIVGQRAAGIDPRRTGIVTLLVFNLVLTFVLANVSIGDHIGGAIGGIAAGLILFQRRLNPWLGLAATLGLATVLFVACLWVSANPVRL